MNTDALPKHFTADEYKVVKQRVLRSPDTLVDPLVVLRLIATVDLLIALARIKKRVTSSRATS